MRRELRDKRHPGNCMDPKFFLAQATDSSASCFKSFKAQVAQVLQGPVLSHFFSLPNWFAKLHSSSLACLIF